MNRIKQLLLEKLDTRQITILIICLLSVLSTGFVVVDKVAPVIKLTDGSDITIDFNTEFDYNNYVTFENTEAIHVLGEVNTQEEGLYTIVVEAINQYGQKKTKTLNITVDDLSSPVLTLKNEEIKLAYGASFKPENYIKSALDNKDGNVKSFVEITNDVNTKKPGTYTVKYYVEDTSGNSTTETLEVTVNKQTTRQKIVAAAISKLGCKYRWGATGPKTFDCSGLTRYCYRQAGVSIPRSSYYQKKSGKVIKISEAKPGDLVWRPGHIGIYVGNGKVIHAPQTGKRVSYTSASSFKCAIRYVK